MAEGDGQQALQEKIQRLQGLGAQLQAASQQRAQFEMMQKESERAHKALDALADDSVVFRSVGSLLVKDDRKAALERLEEEGETLQIRLKRVKEQENELQAQFEGLQNELQKALQG